MAPKYTEASPVAFGTSLTIRRLIARQNGAKGMQSIAKGLRAALLVGCPVVAAAMARGHECSAELCNGPSTSCTPTPEELATVLSTHQAWLEFGREPYDGGAVLISMPSPSHSAISLGS
jgi:hypothetical protein